MDRALRDQPFDPFSRAVLISARSWIERSVSAGSAASIRVRQAEPPFRSFFAERLVPYVYRLLNEWLPAEVATLLTEEGEAREGDEGIPALARAKALDRLLVRERFSSETLDSFLDCGSLSPQLVYPADVEILHDVVLSLSGRLSAPPLPALPAELLGVTGSSTLPPDYASAVRRGFIERAENGEEELHVPIADAAAREIFHHDAVRFGSVAVTMDGRAWLPWTLLHGDVDRIIYRPGERLQIDQTADHAKVTVQWPEAISSCSGGRPPLGPFRLFGREWRAASWEMDGKATLLHLTFSRVLPIASPLPHPTAGGGLQPAHVDMAWAELERALAEATSRNSGEPLEQMVRAELIPLGRALHGLAECVQSNWTLNASKIEQQVRAARYYHASVVEIYGRAPWRILPGGLRAKLATARVAPETLALLSEIFNDAPPVSRQASGGSSEDHSTPPSQAA